MAAAPVALPAAMMVASTVLSAKGQLDQAAAIQRAAQRRKQAAEFEAQQLEQDAGQQKATSQVQAAIEDRNTRLVNSAAVARAAASGAGASDPTVVNLISRTAGEGAFRKAAALYQGESAARLDLQRAAAARFDAATGVEDANAAAKSARIGALSTVLSGGAKGMSMFQKYFTPPDTSTGPSADSYFAGADLAVP